jgi:hypothetical protein
MKDERPQPLGANWRDVLTAHIETSIAGMTPAVVPGRPLSVVEFIMLPCSATIH